MVHTRERRIGAVRQALVAILVLSAAAGVWAQDTGQDQETQQVPQAPRTGGGEAPPTPGGAATTTAAPTEPAAGPDLTEVNQLVRDQDYTGAAGALAALREEFPDDPRLLAMHGEVLVALNRLDEAIPVLRKAIETDPEAPRLHFQLGTALAGTGKHDEALEAFGGELQVNDDDAVLSMARLNRSLLLQRREEYGRAAGELEAVLELQPERVQVYGDLIAVYLEAGMLEEAHGALERAAKAGYTSAEHQQSLAVLLFKAERWAEAAAAFQHALDIDPDLEEARKGLAAARERAGG